MKIIENIKMAGNKYIVNPIKKFNREHPVLSKVVYGGVGAAAGGGGGLLGARRGGGPGGGGGTANTPTPITKKRETTRPNKR